MNLKITTTTTLTDPRGTKVITNDEWITLARKNRNGVVSIFTCLATDIHHYDLFDESLWIELYKEEISAISNL